MSENKVWKIWEGAVWAAPTIPTQKVPRPKTPNQRMTAVISRIQHEYGRRNEERVIAAFHTDHVRLPLWFSSIRLGTAQEDAQGIDAVIATDVGKIFVQIKSSWHEADRFRRKYGKRAEEFVIIVVRSRMSPAAIRSEIVLQAGNRRADILAGRRQHT